MKEQENNGRCRFFFLNKENEDKNRNFTVLKNPLGHLNVLFLYLRDAQENTMKLLLALRCFSMQKDANFRVYEVH